MPEMLQNSEGSRFLPEKKCGKGVPPRSRPTTPLPGTALNRIQPAEVLSSVTLSILCKSVFQLHKIIPIVFQLQNTNYFSLIHSGHFYSASSSPLLLRGAPDYSTNTISEFHAKAHGQLQVKDLPKVPLCGG